MVIKVRWVHTMPTPSTTNTLLPSTSAQFSPFYCVNIKLHKHSVRFTVQPGPEVVGGAHFLITDASYILTHHRSGENRWSLNLSGCRVFSFQQPNSYIHQASERTASGCDQLCGSPMHTETEVCCAHTHTHMPLPVALDRSDAQLGLLWDFRLDSERPQPSLLM